MSPVPFGAGLFLENKTKDHEEIRNQTGTLNPDASRKHLCSGEWILSFEEP